MKPLKYIVLACAIFSFVGVVAFDWITLSGTVPKLLADFPTTGMANGGPVFLFLMAMPLIGSGIGAIRRFGRGLALLSMLGSLMAAFFALVKYNDMEEAAAMAKKLGVTVDVGAGYWIFFAASGIAFVTSLVALIKPEPKADNPTPPRTHGSAAVVPH